MLLRFAFMRALLCTAVVLSALLPAIAASAESPSFDSHVRPLLTKYCFDCHAGESPEAGLRLDQLPTAFDDPAAVKWQRVRERVELGQMPPESNPRPTAGEAKVLTGWIKTETVKAELARREKEGRVTVRRLNRVEYQNTIRDLLGVDVELKELLPADGSSDGFDNNGDALHTSSFLMDRYLEAADTVLSHAIANRPRPATTKQRIAARTERDVVRSGQPVFRVTDDAVVCFSSSAWSGVNLTQLQIRDHGKYRIRISAYAVQSKDPVTFRLGERTKYKGEQGRLRAYFDAPPGKPTVVELVETLEAKTSLGILPMATAGAKTIMGAGGADKYEGPGLAIQWVELEGPLLDDWPPDSHQRIFGDLPQAADPHAARDRVEVTSSDPTNDARRILREFATRAFRRPVTDDELRPLSAVVEAKLAEGYSFEQAVRVGLKGVLVSPRFLFLDEKPGRLDDFALASRLSYFLWSSMPDAELLALAGQKKLSQPGVLQAQVERMLADVKASEFTRNFVGQWLRLREIDFTSPDHRLYPEFDDILKKAMVSEAELFFDDVLKHDLSLTNFTASDFTFVNERLATHYGLEGVEGLEMRKVALPSGSHRGGVMTMAGVLKVTANGTSTSPVYRGAWVLDRILGTPPAQPPDGVSGLEPDIRGAVTIREQLAKHRGLSSCKSCHAKIDPPGFALESFDVIGGWRDRYRVTQAKKPVVIDGRRMRYGEGPEVGPGDVLTDGRRFTDIDELKQLLLADKDQLARCMAGKLITYATGRAPDAADEPHVEAVVAKVRDKEYGFRSLVHEIVQSELFQTK
jgi:hypothetical protein